MTLLTAMEHNHAMMRLVLPSSVNEAVIKNKLDKINKERMKEGTNTLTLELNDPVDFIVTVMYVLCTNIHSYDC